MKVAELRDALGKYDIAQLREIAVELYKCVPKARKEDGDVDALVSDYAGRQAQKKAGIQKTVNFPKLRDEINLFLKFAKEQYYFAPNRFVSKKDRPKWRFLVRGYIKDLLSVTGENSEEAAQLLAQIYKMLCYACKYWIFNTNSPFASVGHTKSDLFDAAAAKIFYNGMTREAITAAVDLAIETWSDYSLDSSLQTALVRRLPTPDAKEIAMEVCEGYLTDFEAARKRQPPTLFHVQPYDVKNAQDTIMKAKNHAVELIFLLKAALREIEPAIAYYVKHAKHGAGKSGEQEKLDHLLGLLSKPGTGELWIREYEKAVARNVEPREYLKIIYKARKNGTYDPDTYYGGPWLFDDDDE